MAQKVVNYEGETGCNCYSRGLEHQDGLRNEQDNPLWKHCTLEHGGEKVEFTMTALGSFRSCLMRQVNESVRISSSQADILLNSKSEFLDADQGNAVMELADKGAFSYVDAFHLGEEIEDTTLLDYHIDTILALPFIDADRIASKNFKVAVDAVNGAGSYAIPALLERLGARVSAIHCTPNGHFPHNPEPLPEHLGEICELIKKEQADLGVVTDPDADRLALVDDKGRLFGEEYTQATAFDFILSKNPGPSATNLSSSRICDEVAAKYGQKCHRSAVGEINVVKKNARSGCGYWRRG